jgi:3',5'-nucleoside bisphosphate phosphatase
MDYYKADLHIHSVLSPCGGLEMSAKNLIEAVKNAGISIIALTDHNSMANCAVYEKVAQQNNIRLIYGVEIQTAEEIHLVALFNNNTEALEFDKLLYDALLPVLNNPDYFGDQVVIDEQENIIRFEEKALINSIQWSLEETVAKLKQYDTFIFPAHIDAETFSIIGQLGFIPPHIEFDAFGITAKCNLEEFLNKNRYLKNKPFIRNSDSHYLNQIGSAFTNFYIEQPCLSEIRFACQKMGDRKAVIS